MYRIDNCSVEIRWIIVCLFFFNFRLIDRKIFIFILWNEKDLVFFCLFLQVLDFGLVKYGDYSIEGGKFFIKWIVLEVFKNNVCINCDV